MFVVVFNVCLTPCLCCGYLFQMPAAPLIMNVSYPPRARAVVTLDSSQSDMGVHQNIVTHVLCRGYLKP